MKKISAQDIIEGNVENRFAFSLSGMTRESVMDDEEAVGSYDEFVSSMAGETQPSSNRAKFDLDRLKEGSYFLQPAWSPLSVPSYEDTMFHLDDQDNDVPSNADGEETEPR